MNAILSTDNGSIGTYTRLILRHDCWAKGANAIYPNANADAWHLSWVRRSWHCPQAAKTTDWPWNCKQKCLEETKQKPKLSQRFKVLFQKPYPFTESGFFFQSFVVFGLYFFLFLLFSFIVGQIVSFWRAWKDTLQTTLPSTPSNKNHIGIVSANVLFAFALIFHLLCNLSKWI